MSERKKKKREMKTMVKARGSSNNFAVVATINPLIDNTKLFYPFSLHRTI
jgi:hypothetical protein